MKPTTTKRAVRLSQLARKLHEGQTDLQGAPYFEHVAQVARQAGHRGGKHAYIVGLFHDAVEDEKTSFGALAPLLTEDELIAVGLLTRKADQPYADYILVIRDAPGPAGAYAREVKCADLTHNLGRMTPEIEAAKPHLRERYERALGILEAERLVA